MSLDSKKVYITRSGLKDFQNELKRLYEVRRDKVGNPEEDPDEVILLNQKIEEIERVLKSHEVIKFPSKNKRDVVHLGATVTVEVDGHTSDLTIVGPPEVNPPLGLVSHESPVGKALLGCKAGDVVTLSSTIKMPYKIKKISYS